MRRFSLLALAALLGACAQPVTQLVIVVDSDYTPGELESVTITTFDPASPGLPRDTVTRDVARTGDATHVTIPFSFALVPGERPPESEVELEVSGALASGRIVRRVRTNFLPGSTAIVRVHLSRDCQEVTTCPGTCEWGECVPLRRDPVRVDGLVPGSELDGGPRDPRDGAMLDGGEGDGGVDAAGIDGGPGELSCVPGTMRPAFVDPGTDYDIAYDGTSLVLASASTPGLVLLTEGGNRYSIIHDENIARPAIARHPGGWIVSFNRGAGRDAVSAAIIPPDFVSPSTLFGDLYTSDHPTVVVADGAFTVLALAGSSGPSYGTLVGMANWSATPELLETGHVDGRPALAQRVGGHVYAWADENTVRARRMMSGTSLTVLPPQYAATSVAPVVAVDADLNGSGFVTVAWHDEPWAPVVLARFDDTLTSPTAVLSLHPEDLPIIGPAAVALQEDGSAAVLIRSERGTANELRLALVGPLGELSYALIRMASARSTHQWIWALGERAWLIAWEEGTTVYAMDVTCD